MHFLYCFALCTVKYPLDNLVLVNVLIVSATCKLILNSVTFVTYDAHLSHMVLDISTHSHLDMS